MTVAAILRHKGHEIASVVPEATIAELVKMLAEYRIGAAPVIDGRRQLVGIISERDIVRSLATNGAATLQMTAEELMTPSPRTVSPRATVAQAMEMMTAGRFRHLPVVEGDALVGVISIGDVVKARIIQQESEVDSLKAYVVGAA
jgi:CBS domain-containing protein